MLALRHTKLDIEAFAGYIACWYDRKKRSERIRRIGDDDVVFWDGIDDISATLVGPSKIGKRT